ncbi:MAG: hypothetical protein U0441_08865 [Polyangiaceae bacterium]
MRYPLSAITALLFACGCGAAPPSPPERPAEVASPPWVEIVDHQGRAAVVGHASNGAVRYTVPVADPHEVVPTPGGGACLITGEGTRGVNVTCVDEAGKVLWTDAHKSAATVRLFLSGKDIFIFDLGPQLFARIFDVKTGDGVKRAHFPVTATDAARLGDDFVFAGDDVVSRWTAAGELVWRVPIRVFPSTSPAPRRAERRVAVNAAGVILSGASDGSLVALDKDGRPLYQLGVRGPVSRIEAREDGDFVVRAADVATVIGPHGVIRREVASSAEAPQRQGIVDHRTSSDPPSLRISLAYRKERQTVDGKPFDEVESVASLGPNDAWALVGAEQVKKVYHFDGRSWTLRDVAQKYPSEVFVDGEAAEESQFVPYQLARGPKGTLLAIGRREGYKNKRFSVLEYDGTTFRERADWKPLLSTMHAYWGALPEYTVSPGGHEVICGDKKFGCVEAAPGLSPQVLPIDRGEGLPGVESTPTWGVLRRFESGGVIWKARGAAFPEGDMIGVGPRGLFHGTKDREIEPFAAPVQYPESVWATSKSNLWVAESRALARFDGSRWWRIPEVYGSVTGSGPDDVWVYGRDFWHLTPDPSARPDIESATALPPPAASSEPLRIAGVDPSYRIERAAMDVDKGPPLRTAVRVVRGPGGVYWLHEGSRVAEYDGARAKILYAAKDPEPFHCWSAPEPDCEVCMACTARLPAAADCHQCVAPAGPGEGAMIIDGAWQWARGGTTSSPRVDVGPLAAIAAASPGVIWGVALDQETQPGVLVQDEKGSRFLMGLPLAVYTAMDIRAPDDAWIAGGLTRDRTDDEAIQAEGEGTLVHHDGKTFSRSRGTEGALLAVTASGPNEAWSVGLNGGVLHQKAASATAFHLESEDGKRLRVALRAVAVLGPTEVLFAGESGTLLRWDGATLRRIDTTLAGRNTTFSGLIPPTATTAGWLSGPGGLWKIVRAR